MTGTAGDISNTQAEQSLFGVEGLESLGDQVVERVLDEWLNQFIRRVVRSCRRAFIALFEAELNPDPPL